jgi:hypothetical protein
MENSAALRRALVTCQLDVGATVWVPTWTFRGHPDRASDSAYRCKVLAVSAGRVKVQRYTDRRSADVPVCAVDRSLVDLPDETAQDVYRRHAVDGGLWETREAKNILAQASERVDGLVTARVEDELLRISTTLHGLAEVVTRGSMTAADELFVSRHLQALYQNPLFGTGSTELIVDIMTDHVGQLWGECAALDGDAREMRDVRRTQRKRIRESAWNWVNERGAKRCRAAVALLRAATGEALRPSDVSTCAAAADGEKCL